MKETITELKKEIDRLSSLVDYDFLTGVYNRAGFLKEAKKFMEEFRKSSSKEKRKFAIKNLFIIFSDLNNLKAVNDLYGHKAGDAYIKACVGVFKNSLREIDIIGRWGGDEFVIGLININKADAQKVVSKLKDKLSGTYAPNTGNKLRLSVSFGVYPAFKSSNINQLIHKADKKMYKDKRKK